MILESDQICMLKKYEFSKQNKLEIKGWKTDYRDFIINSTGEK